MIRLFNTKLIVPLFIVSVVIIGLLFWKLTNSGNSIDKETFMAPGRNWQSSKKVEDYFVEKLRMTQEDLQRNKDRTTIDFRLSDGSTLQAVLGNLHYYGFIRSEDALRYALENTEDKVVGKEEAIKVGKNSTVDTNASYRISEDMTAWEMADTLLNNPKYFGSHDNYGYLFMP